MEDNKKSKGSSIAIIACVLLALGGISFGVTMGILGLLQNNNSGTQVTRPAASNVVDFGTYRIEKYNDEPYYVYQKAYDGDYYIQILNFDYYDDDGTSTDLKLLSSFRKNAVLSYDEYEEFCEKWGLEQRYVDEDQNYAVISNYFIGAPIVEAKLANIQEEGSSVWLYYYDHNDGITADIGAYAIVVPVDDDIEKVVPVPLYSEEEFEQIKDPSPIDPDEIVVKKPIIYLYPESETEVLVTLGKPENLTVSYPRYDGSWNVVAKPNGDLVDLKAGRGLYALYYESLVDDGFGIQKDGFVVKGSEAAAFLEEKLSILGLTDREAEEFIVYWLPVLEANEYNYIHFESADLINEKMPLNVSPSPDSVIRVWMSYKALDNPIEITEQKLEAPVRRGFTVVEWGGAELR